MIWYAPKRVEGESDGATSIRTSSRSGSAGSSCSCASRSRFVALWQGRRIGPLVAEDLPVVVRASETVEGRGRLYRSRRARDRAASALRTAVAAADAAPARPRRPSPIPPPSSRPSRGAFGHDPPAVEYALFGPPPADDAELVNLARLLDDIERQVAHS